MGSWKPSIIRSRAHEGIQCRFEDIYASTQCQRETTSQAWTHPKPGRARRRRRPLTFTIQYRSVPLWTPHNFLTPQEVEPTDSIFSYTREQEKVLEDTAPWKTE